MQQLYLQSSRLLVKDFLGETIARVLGDDEDDENEKNAGSV